MMIKATTEQLIKWVTITIFTEFALTSIHHVYGGLIYGTPYRMMMPIASGIAFIITLGLLVWYQRKRSGVALALFAVMTALVWIAMDLVDSIYGHTYKNILFLAGVPTEVALKIHPTLMGADFVYPPNDVFYELTGLMKLVTIYWIAILTYHLIRDWQTGYRSSPIPVARTVAGGLGLLALIVGASLLEAYTVTNNVSTLVLSLMMIGQACWLSQSSWRGIFRREPDTIRSLTVPARVESQQKQIKEILSWEVENRRATQLIALFVVTV